MTRVSYRPTPGDDGLAAMVAGLAQETSARTLCDLGGGANPLLPADLIAERGVRYIVVDRAPEQLNRAPDTYEKVVADLSTPNLPPPVRCDLAFSRYLMEHVADPRAFHQNVHAMLCDGGRAVHLFPTLYSLPFVVNRLIPERLSEPLLPLFLPGRERGGLHAKFPAYYRKCRGPTPWQIRWFEGQGFVVEEYVGFFGHPYFGRIPGFRAAKGRLVPALIRFPVPLLTSFALVVLRRR